MSTDVAEVHPFKNEDVLTESSQDSISKHLLFEMAELVDVVTKIKPQRESFFVFFERNTKRWMDALRGFQLYMYIVACYSKYIAMIDTLCEVYPYLRAVVGHEPLLESIDKMTGEMRFLKWYLEQFKNKESDDYAVSRVLEFMASSPKLMVSSIIIASEFSKSIKENIDKDNAEANVAMLAIEAYGDMLSSYKERMLVLEEFGTSMKRFYGLQNSDR